MILIILDKNPSKLILLYLCEPGEGSENTLLKNRLHALQTVRISGFGLMLLQEPDDAVHHHKMCSAPGHHK